LGVDEAGCEEAGGADGDDEERERPAEEPARDGGGHAVTWTAWRAVTTPEHHGV
jgi:hypothetical protein